MRIKLTQEDKQLLQSVKDKLDNDFRDDFTNYALSKEFHMGDHKLRHGFKLLFGVSIRQYHEQKRMEYAIHLLNDTDMSVTQIILEVGYKETRTFYRAFKKLYRVTPFAWRSRRKNATEQVDKDLAFDKQQKSP
jgi:AraC-like DNA-binding protein